MKHYVGRVRSIFLKRPLLTSLHFRSTSLKVAIFLSCPLFCLFVCLFEIWFQFLQWLRICWEGAGIFYTETENSTSQAITSRCHQLSSNSWGNHFKDPGKQLGSFRKNSWQIEQEHFKLQHNGLAKHSCFSPPAALAES